MASKEASEGDETRGGEVKLNVGVVSIRLPTEVEEQADPSTIAELKAEVSRDLLSIAATPTKLLAELFKGLVRIVRVATFGGGRPEKQKRLSRAEALENLQAVLKKHGGVVVDQEGRPVIVLGELAQKVLAERASSGEESEEGEGSQVVLVEGEE